ncbi:hypothetical protein AMAG_07398 [Allomyces macrogynus ATCC 38327]|uniref:Metal homeostatis protein bsd2 n=1 Tax=Allomyces macrogynus (strain ATCC 38327) TaxID=578462 RepID=A0A0L0SI03_ALLM3|nr:hypothetical protein AMAG_07398 [Allomyces macrogynus ATCC 38327]|eukprot:KNE62153.1 hypothetical protein AMAG_07398 [Allomyces macrogynus ATCC 38327]
MTNTGNKYQQVPLHDADIDAHLDDDTSTATAVPRAAEPSSAASSGANHRDDADADGDVSAPLMAASDAASPAPAALHAAAEDDDDDAPIATLMPVASPDSSAPPSPPRRTISAKSDGVFSHLSAKPEVAPTARSDSPTAPPADLPPSYETAVTDPTPAYFDNTIFTTQLDDGELLVEGLPVGSPMTFFLAMFISMSFQFAGFLMAYLLATSHAGRMGAKVGFGVTLLQYGILLRTRVMDIEDSGNPLGDADFASSLPPDTTPDEAEGILIRTEWVSYLLLVCGWYLLIRSAIEFFRVKRLQAVVMAAPEALIV